MHAKLWVFPSWDSAIEKVAEDDTFVGYVLLSAIPQLLHLTSRTANFILK